MVGDLEPTVTLYPRIDVKQGISRPWSLEGGPAGLVREGFIGDLGVVEVVPFEARLAFIGVRSYVQQRLELRVLGHRRGVGVNGVEEGTSAGDNRAPGIQEGIHRQAIRVTPPDVAAALP